MCSSSTRDTTEVLFELERWRADASGVCNDCPDHLDEVPLNAMADVVACVVVGNVGGDMVGDMVGDMAGDTGGDVTGDVVCVVAMSSSDSMLRSMITFRFSIFAF